MTQQARNLVMQLDEQRRTPLYLIHNRDGKFTSEGVKIIPTPVRAPNAMPTPGGGSAPSAVSARPAADLQPPAARILRVYVRFYNGHRPQRALDLRPPTPIAASAAAATLQPAPTRIERNDLPGGLLHEYRAVA